MWNNYVPNIQKLSLLLYKTRGAQVQSSRATTLQPLDASHLITFLNQMNDSLSGFCRAE